MPDIASLLEEADEVLKAVNKVNAVSRGTLQREKALHKKLRKVFRKIRRDVIAWHDRKGSLVLSDAAAAALGGIFGGHLAEYYQVILNAKRDALSYGIRQTERMIPKDLRPRKKTKKSTEAYSVPDDMSGFYDPYGLYTPDVAILLEEETWQFCEQTIARMTGDVMGNLAESYNMGLGQYGAAVRLEECFTDMELWELERIARTEINGGQSLGGYSMISSSRCRYHQWIAADDSRTRTSHEQINGEIVKIGDCFSNGLRYPHEFGASAAEVVNCRCRDVPFIMPLGYAAPVGLSPFRRSDLVYIGE